METAELKVRIKNPGLQTAHALDANGISIAELPLDIEDGVASFDFPEGTLYVVLEGQSGLSYDLWKSRFSWETEASDALAGADPDGDGASNLIEFVRAGDPLRFDGEAIEKARLDKVAGEPALMVSYRRNAIMVGVEDRFEYSEDLREWTALSGLSAQVLDSQIEVEPDGSTEEREIVVPLVGEADMAFVRRKVNVE